MQLCNRLRELRLYIIHDPTNAADLNYMNLKLSTVCALCVYVCLFNQFEPLIHLYCVLLINVN